jgi:hypothetical protein
VTPEFQAGLWLGCAVGVALTFALLMAAFAMMAAEEHEERDDE